MKLEQEISRSKINIDRASTCRRGQCPIWVVIVTHNASSWIENCLKTVMKSIVDVAVIVVDNNSTDNTKDLIQEYFPELSILQQSENLGFGRANNIGIRHALDNGADYIFLLNQDAAITKKTIERLVEVAVVNPSFGILSPLHLNDDGTAFDINFSMRLCELLPQLFFDQRFKRLKEVYELEYTNAAAWLLTREFVSQVGGFDPLFFMYGEDDDLINRAKFHGYKIGLVPAAAIYHYRSAQVSDRHTLRNMPKRHESAMIKLLKLPTSSFHNNIYMLTYYIVGRSGRSLIKGDWQSLSNLFLAIPLALVKIRTIYRHRALCRKTGPHFVF